MNKGVLRQFLAVLTGKEIYKKNLFQIIVRKDFKSD